ncbi:hypothetical protein HK100_008475 [Physocladia obscura]|uniref:Uncharacterized protein n=1 Tax=Physocladia obscura TaxID=109957 RepID=A0AAD5T420_9FUNG|nr:hypothetical protein HK100_008475 [Physocladia obscura]
MSQSEVLQTEREVTERERESQREGVLRVIYNETVLSLVQNAQILYVAEIEDPVVSFEELLTVTEGRKWKLLLQLTCDFDRRESDRNSDRNRNGDRHEFFDATLPEQLEGRVSNYVFARRIGEVNAHLSLQPSLKTIHPVLRTTIRIVVPIIVLICIFAFDPLATPLYIAWFIVALGTYHIANLVVAFTPAYEKSVAEACKIWSADDAHLHLAYLSIRAHATKPNSVIAAIKDAFVPTETDWFIRIYESVAILPINIYGVHRGDRSGITAATDPDGPDFEDSRVLPVYAPPWDATPAPIYSTAPINEHQDANQQETLNSQSTQQQMSQVTHLLIPQP